MDAQHILTVHVVPKQAPRLSAPASVSVISATATTYPRERVGRGTQVPKNDKQDKWVDGSMISFARVEGLEPESGGTAGVERLSSQPPHVKYLL